MPDPKEAVHNVLVCKPRYKLLKEEGADGDQGAKQDRHVGDLSHCLLKYDSSS